MCARRRLWSKKLSSVPNRTTIRRHCLHPVSSPHIHLRPCEHHECLYPHTLLRRRGERRVLRRAWNAIKKLSETEHLFLLGDFNAQIGSDHISLHRCIGHFGVGKLKENRTCALSDLCATNTFYSTKTQHRVFWQHPRSRHWHQLDLVHTHLPQRQL